MKFYSKASYEIEHIPYQKIAFADPVITGATCVLQHLGQGTISKYGAVWSPILLLASLFTNTLGQGVKLDVGDQVEIQSKLDKVQRDLQANIADAQNDLAAAQATAQLTTDVNIRNHAEKSQRLLFIENMP